MAADSRLWEQPVPDRDCCCPSSGWSQAGRHMAGGQETETWIDMTCRVRLNIYSGGYEGGREKGRETEIDREREIWGSREVGREAEAKLPL